MGKKRTENYETKIVLKEGVKFTDLLKVAAKAPRQKQAAKK